jgi:hypothetical protein
MREIKFRGWDKERGKMTYPEEYVDMGCFFEDHKPKQGFFLMQSTNRHDKKGKEIYEGDIVISHKEYNNYTGLNSKLYAGNRYEVMNNGWRFYFFPKGIYSVDITELEIIGNIYENPSLLAEASPDNPKGD